MDGDDGPGAEPRMVVGQDQRQKKCLWARLEGRAGHVPETAAEMSACWLSVWRWWNELRLRTWTKRTNIINFKRLFETENRRIRIMLCSVDSIAKTNHYSCPTSRGW